AQHDNQHIAPLDVIHSPARTKVFTHFADALAYRRHITQVAALNLIQALCQANSSHAILQAANPSLELRRLLDCEHKATVIAYSHCVNIPGLGGASGWVIVWDRLWIALYDVTQASE